MPKTLRPPRIDPVTKQSTAPGRPGKDPSSLHPWIRFVTLGG